MGYFQVMYEPRVVILNRRAFRRLKTGLPSDDVSDVISDCQVCSYWVNIKSRG